MPQEYSNHISQEFIKAANEQLTGTEALKSDNVLQLLKIFVQAEDNLKCALYLYIGNDQAYYELVKLYDMVFEKYPRPDGLDLPKKESRDAMVLAGRKLGIKECISTELIFNPPKPTENSINTLIYTVQTV